MIGAAAPIQDMVRRRRLPVKCPSGLLHSFPGLHKGREPRASPYEDRSPLRVPRDRHRSCRSATGRCSGRSPFGMLAKPVDPGSRLRRGPHRSPRPRPVVPPCLQNRSATNLLPLPDGFRGSCRSCPMSGRGSAPRGPRMVTENATADLPTPYRRAFRSCAFGPDAGSGVGPRPGQARSRGVLDKAVEALSPVFGPAQDIRWPSPRGVARMVERVEVIVPGHGCSRGAMIPEALHRMKARTCGPTKSRRSGRGPRRAGPPADGSG